MNYKTFQLYFSNPRVNRYYYAANSSKRKTISLYKQNLLIAQAIHPVIGVFEVVLRNSIYNATSNYFQDENWIVNQKEGVMSDKALVFRNNPSKISKRITSSVIPKFKPFTSRFMSYLNTSMNDL